MGHLGSVLNDSDYACTVYFIYREPLWSVNFESISDININITKQLLKVWLKNNKAELPHVRQLGFLCKDP